MTIASSILFSIALAGSSAPASIEDTAGAEGNLAVLMKAMACDDFWVAVHATEYMIDLGHKQQAERHCTAHLLAYEQVPQKRIGLWRIQYRLASTAGAKSQITNKLVDAYLAPDGPDRIHAAETLAKLGFCFDGFDQRAVQGDMQAGGMLGAFVAWGMSVACSLQDNDDHSRLIGLLQGDMTERKLAAYGLSFLTKPTAPLWRILAKAALEEADEEAKAYLLGAAYQLYRTDNSADAAIYMQVRAQLLTLVDSNTKSARMELCRALAGRRDSEAKAVLTRLAGLESPITSLPEGEMEPGLANRHPWNIDIRATAAYALLKQYNK